MSYTFDELGRAQIAQRCAAFERLIDDNDAPAEGLKRAAVAIVVVEAEDGSGEAAFVLTKRVAKLRAHAGQWALPGGRCDEGETLVETVLREMREEVGLALTADDVLGVLDDYPTRSGYAITPVVLWAGKGAELTPNPDEVAYIRRIPLSHIAHDEAVEFLTIPESERQVIRLKIEGHFVHAPTGAMLWQFAEVIRGRDTRVAMYEQPVFAWK